MRQNRAEFIGITGGIGSGKSTVTRYLREKGYPVIDADQLARRAVEPGSLGLKQIIQRFGETLLTKEGTLDRKRLGTIVFSDSDALKALNAIVHPIVEDLLQEDYKFFSSLHDVVFADIPLLYETDQAFRYDAVWLVYASREMCVERIVKRDGATREYANQQIDSQISLETKKTLADLVLVNESDEETLYRQIDTALSQILK